MKSKVIPIHLRRFGVASSSKQTKELSKLGFFVQENSMHCSGVTVREEVSNEKKHRIAELLGLVTAKLDYVEKELEVSILKAEPQNPDHGKSSGKSLWVYRGLDHRGRRIDVYCKILSKSSKEYFHYLCVKNNTLIIKKQDFFIIDIKEGFAAVFVKDTTTKKYPVKYGCVLRVIQDLATRMDVNKKCDHLVANMKFKCVSHLGKEFVEPFDLLPQKWATLGRTLEMKVKTIRDTSLYWREKLVPYVEQAPTCYAHGSLHHKNYYRESSGLVVVYDWECAQFAPIGYDLGYVAGLRARKASGGAVFRFRGKNQFFFSERRVADAIQASYGVEDPVFSYGAMLHTAIGVCYAQYVNRIYEYFTKRITGMGSTQLRTIKSYLALRKHEIALESYFVASESLMRQQSPKLRKPQ